MLENVDRLLKSPAKQRGRDFAIMLASLLDLGYAVEWRVINAADYGFPQRRRRVFMLGYHESTKIYKNIIRKHHLSEWVLESGVFAKAFPVRAKKELLYPEFLIKGDVVTISESFNKERPNKSPFHNAGVMIGRRVFTVDTHANYHGKRKVLNDVLIPDKEVPKEYYLDEKDIPRWKYLKGEKHILRESKKTGKTFKYDEGPMVFPDDIDRPSRTIVTGEGGPAPSRFKHVVKTKDGKLRRLTPVELEKLNMFPPDHTKGVPDVKRAFLMGNAIVVGVVERLGKQLVKSTRNGTL